MSVIFFPKATLKSPGRLGSPGVAGVAGVETTSKRLQKPESHGVAWVRLGSPRVALGAL